MKRAILVVSFGTSHAETCAKTIEVIEREIRVNHPEYLVYRAWTSEVIRRKVEARDGVHVFSVKEALEHMRKDGITEIIVQPTFMIDGVENEWLLGELLAYANSPENKKVELLAVSDAGLEQRKTDAKEKKGNSRRENPPEHGIDITEEICRITVGTPLLTTQEDQNKVLDALLAEWQLQPDEFLLLMGHGSQNEANAVYEELNMVLERRGCRNIRIGTLHEFETSMNYIENRCDKEKVCTKEISVDQYAGGYFENVSDSHIYQRKYLQKIILAPFMIVSGSHAVHNMAGNQESSWKSRLEKAGFEVECVMRGLGEYPGIRNLIYAHLDTIVSDDL